MKTNRTYKEQKAINNSMNTLVLHKQNGGGNVRISSIDIAKALGMLTIMWGHVRLGSWSTAFVYAFHIPLFFFLSGLVFNRDRYRDFNEFIKKRIKSLLIPYVIFSFITWIIWVAFSYVTHLDVESYWMPFAQTFIAQGSGGFLVHDVPLWFVTCLFVIEMIYYFLSKLDSIWVIITTFTMAIASYSAIEYCSYIDITLMPWNMEVVCLGIPIYAIGHLIARKWSIQKMQLLVLSNQILSIIIVFFCAAVVFAGSQYNGTISFGHSELGKNVFVTYACSFVGTAMIIILSMVMACYSNSLIKSLLWFGRNSFNAMAIHNPIKGFVCVVTGIVFHCGSRAVSANDVYSLLAFFATLVITIIGMVVVNWIKRKYQDIIHR